MLLLQEGLNQANTVFLLMAAASLICWTPINDDWWISVHEQASNACLEMRLPQFTLVPCFKPSLPITPLLMPPALIQCFDLQVWYLTQYVQVSSRSVYRWLPKKKTTIQVL
jgi:hypothetical protein